jgi:DNA replication protein DnaC
MTAALPVLLRALKLPGIAEHYAGVAETAAREGWRFDEYLTHLLEIELSERRRRRIVRLVKESNLPADKTLGTLELARLPVPVRRMLPVLCEGGFAERGDNVLAFGLPGRGKTHVLAAIGNELVRKGVRVLFVAAFALVQRLLAAKRALGLEKLLRELDGFDVITIDDIGYIQQDREEMEVLFTFLAERYERRSVMISSNLMFSQWDRIFKDAMTTAAAIDRLVHHSVILELTGPSIRNEVAHQRASAEAVLAPDAEPTPPGPVDAAGPGAEGVGALSAVVPTRAPVPQSRKTEGARASEPD